MRKWDLDDNTINILDELNNSSTLKEDFSQPCKEAFTQNNSESIIDFNMDPQFKIRTCDINDSSNFYSMKQIDGEKYEVIYDSNKRNDNNNNNTGWQKNDADIDFAITQMKELLENAKKLHA